MKNWKYIEGAKTGNVAADITTDGNTWFVTTSDGKKKEFPSEREAEAYVKKIKTGNEDKTGAEEFFKKLSDDVKEREKKDDKEIKLVGNETYQHKLYPNKYVIIEGNNYKIVTDGKVEKSGVLTDAVLYGINQTYKRVGNKVGNIKNLDRNTGTIDWDVAIFNGQWYITMNGQKLKGPFPSMKEAERYLDGHKWELQGKYGNAKTGNKKLKFTSKTDGKIEYVYDEESQDGFIYDDGKLVDTIKGAGQGWLNLIKQKAFSSGVMNKVGNARYTTREDVISHLDTDLYDICKKVPAGSPSFAYVSELQKKGWDISTISKYTKEIGKIIDQYKVGNSKTGNVQYHKVGKITIKLEANDDDWTVYDTSGHELKSGKGGLGRAKTWAEHFARFTNKRTGNSASDDKFAYVMREFDEGKLKTPDGKVVTDPAQAKAIAYSESKKTENGLARARKAIK